MKCLLRSSPLVIAFIIGFWFNVDARAGQDEIGSADIINRVERVQRVGAETAATWYAGVSNLDAWLAQLEQALLITLGPARLRDPQAGLQTLETLLKTQPADSTRITEDGLETLAVVTALIRRVVTAEEQRDRAASELKLEREAHQQTLEKLRALREIDQQLDERKDNKG